MAARTFFEEFLVGGVEQESVTFAGILPDSSTVFVTFTVDQEPDGAGGAPDFQEFLFPSTFENVVRLESSAVTTPANAFSLDNFTFSSVPEPSTLFLLLTSLPLLRRKR